MFEPVLRTFWSDLGPMCSVLVYSCTRVHILSTRTRGNHGSCTRTRTRTRGPRTHILRVRPSIRIMSALYRPRHQKDIAAYLFRYSL